jgi:hypothetical protein
LIPAAATPKESKIRSQGVEIPEFSRLKIDQTVAELKEERDLVRELLG